MSYGWHFKKRSTKSFLCIDLHRHLKGQALSPLSGIKSAQVLTHVEQELRFFALYVMMIKNKWNALYVLLRLS